MNSRTIGWLAGLGAVGRACCFAGGDPGVDGPRAKNEIKQTIASEFRYDHQVHEKAAAEAAVTDPTAVTMDRVVVREQRVQEQINRDLDEKSRAEKAKAFTFENGGRIAPFKLGSLPGEVGVWPYKDIISSSVGAGGPPKFDLLHLRF